MDQDIFTAQVIGVFMAETAKNIAKGSANLVYEKFHLFFESEIVQLNLNENSSPEEVTKLLKEKPEIFEKVQRKLNAYPELAEQMGEVVAKESDYSRVINANNYFEKVKNLTLNQSGNFTFHNAQPDKPKANLKADITFWNAPSFGNLEQIYNWRITLRNVGQTTVQNFRVDIKFPNIFLSQNIFYYIEVQESRTDDYRLFRTTSAGHNNKAIYQDDVFPVFSGDFTITKGMKENGELERLITISVFADDVLVEKIEKKMSELFNI